MSGLSRVVWCVADQGYSLYRYMGLFPNKQLCGGPLGSDHLEAIHALRQVAHGHVKPFGVCRARAFHPTDGVKRGPVGAAFHGEVVAFAFGGSGPVERYGRALPFGLCRPLRGDSVAFVSAARA